MATWRMEVFSIPDVVEMLSSAWRGVPYKSALTAGLGSQEPGPDRVIITSVFKRRPICQYQSDFKIALKLGFKLQ